VGESNGTSRQSMSEIEKLRADNTHLRALLDAAEARAVGVRELVWERASADAQDVSAKTALGDYQISVDSAFAGESHYLWVAGQAEDDEPHATFPTMRKAKAAAQSHFAALHPASPLGAEPVFVSNVMQRLRRFEEITEDVEGTGVDIGRDWLDALTFLGLLDRVQKSPALWQITDAGAAALAPFARKGE